MQLSIMLYNRVPNSKKKYKSRRSDNHGMPILQLSLILYCKFHLRNMFYIYT